MINAQHAHASVMRCHRTAWRLCGAKGSFADYLAKRGISDTPPAPPAERQSSVYFIGADDGPVKIGVASNPASRLQAIQTGHPHPVRILATMAGGFDVEREYHRRFASARLHGEWFTRTPEIEAEISRLTQLEQAA